MDRKNADSLASSVKPDVLIGNWNRIRHRIDELADEINRHLTHDEGGVRLDSSPGDADG